MISSGAPADVTTATFRILYVFIVLNHDRRQVIHFNVTVHPTSQWTAQQLVEAFPFDSAPRYLLRDRDAIYGDAVQRRIKSLGIEEAITAPATARLLPRACYRAPATARLARHGKIPALKGIGRINGLS